MFVFSRLSRVPPGTLTIYMNRIYHNRKNQSPNIRLFHSTTQGSFLFNAFGSSPSSETPKDGSGNGDSAAGPSKGVIDPSGCKNPPPLNVKWFYATDVPNSQPALYGYEKTKEPEKFLPFSDQDSERVENQYQNILQKGELELIPGFEPHIIPVQEDKLFECDLRLFELRPIYWEGAVFEIRRGIWFDKDNTPAKQLLADELEQLFSEIKPYEKDFESLKDARVLTKKLQSVDKIAVFTKDNSCYLLDNDSTFTDLQVKYLTAAVIPPLLPVEKFSRGYSLDKGKEKKNLKNDIDSTLKDPKLPREIVDDYSNNTVGDREVDHLVICVHGIGQILGTKFESINFIHTINVLRQTMKKVFKENKVLQQIAYHDSEPDVENCKVQVLPVIWRHKVDFNSSKSTQESEEKDKVKLSDITIDGIRPLRDMLGDIVLDVLLYYEPYYMHQILEEVVSQVNEVYDKFKLKNPNFNGKVSLVGHSLGSAICFDLLCAQPAQIPELDQLNPSKHLKFPVENFFAIGSPIGVFGLLKNAQYSARTPSGVIIKGDDPTVKSPKLKNLYNIFHPCDPVAYRIEPLISKEFSNYKPAVIPFASKTIDTQIQNLTQFGDELTNKVMENLNSALNTITPQKQLNDKNKQKNPDGTVREHVSNVSQSELSLMTKFNYSGRIDYALPASIFDISLISMINSHTSYFEEPNVAGFLVRELLLNKKIVKDKKVLLLEAEEDDEEYFTVDEEKSI